MNANAPTKKTNRTRYGDKYTWEIVLEAVMTFGRPVSAIEIRAHLASTRPDFNLSNVSPDLCSLTVNCNSRGNFNANREPRRSDTGHAFDKLYKNGGGTTARYTLYDPAVDDVWELKDVGHKVLRPKALGQSKR